MNGIAKFAGVPSPIAESIPQEVYELARSKPPTRPPVFCPGCPHRASFYSIRRVANMVSRNPKRYGLDDISEAEAILLGDIGCYGLGYLPPFKTIEASICMGGGIGIANGIAQIVKAPIIVSIGDSTFFHAGVPALINAVHNRARMVVCILDNDVTAMTGEQPTPGSAIDAMGRAAPRVKLEDLARGCGASFVEVVDPSDFKRAQDVLLQALQNDGPSVVVFRRVCELIRVREKRRSGIPIIPYTVDQEKCTKCLICVNQFSCPAIYKAEDGSIHIDPVLCTGCRDCSQICPVKAGVSTEEARSGG